ncbi:MAG: hypothetical protein ACYC0V_00245 [Armatimonadota bacterium]
MSATAAARKSVKPKYPKKIMTKIVGTSFDGRQRLLEKAELHDIRVLDLVPDGNNPSHGDPNAIAVEAPVYKNGIKVRSVRLGFISNADRTCIVCGKMVDGQTFTRSKSVKCPECSMVQPCESNETHTCTGCGSIIDVYKNKTATCPTCASEEWARDGLATLLTEAMRAGNIYTCRVQEYTGGDINERTGKKKSLGCNIVIEIL